MARNGIPSGDQVRKQHGLGDGKCVWCGKDKTCDHIIIQCIVARFAWGVLHEATWCRGNASAFSGLIPVDQRNVCPKPWVGLGEVHRVGLDFMDDTR